MMPLAGTNCLAPWRDYLRHLAAKGGPEASDYAAYDGWLKTLADAVRSGALAPLDLQLLLSEGGRATSSTATMQGFMRVKPHGYAGDFELIDRIYTGWRSPDPELRRWDDFFHDQAAFRAVRRAKSYFHRWLARADTGFRPGAARLHFLHLGGGPGRELLDYFLENPGSRIACTYMDPDPSAIAYAATVCREIPGRVSFSTGNPLRAGIAARPDLISVFGLLDDLDDANAGSFLFRLWRLLRPGGELLATHFSPDNPTRSYMEVNGWTVAPRDLLDLAALAERAGIAPSGIRVLSDSEGVLSYIHLIKD